MKRIGLFVFYDKDGIVDRYVVFLLEKMMEYLDQLYIVCNGTLREREKLLQFTKNVYIRPNVGFDAAAWKYLLCEVISQEELSQYDEMILWNDTFYGPIYPLSELFGKMEREECDFWGITSHAKSEDPMKTCKLGYFPEHIQTYFFAVRKKMFLDPCFITYWKKLPLGITFEDVVGSNEVLFTHFFSENGFRWSVYVDMREVDARENYKGTHFIEDSYELLVRYRSPFYKKKNFIHERGWSLVLNNGSFVKKSLQYIVSNTIYDESMIYENILRIYDINRLVNTLGLYEVISSDHNEITEEWTRAAIFVYLHNSSYQNDFIYMLQKIRTELPIYIGVPSRTAEQQIRERLAEKYQISEVRCLNSGGNGIGALLIGFKDVIKRYDLIAFVHDELFSPQEHYTNKMTAISDMWEAIIGGGGYINNVLEMFRREPYLGLLVPLRPQHGSYFYLVHHVWGLSFQKATDIMKRLDLKRVPDPSVTPVSFGNMFWCRSTALRNLLDENWDYGEFSVDNMTVLDDTTEFAIAKILPYIAQENGFYTKVISNKDAIINQYANASALLRQITEYTMSEFPGEYGITARQFMSQMHLQSGRINEKKTVISDLHYLKTDSINTKQMARHAICAAVIQSNSEDEAEIIGLLRAACDKKPQNRKCRFYIKDPYGNIHTTSLNAADIKKHDVDADQLSYFENKWIYSDKDDLSFALKIPVCQLPCGNIPYSFGIINTEERWFAENEPVILLNKGKRLNTLVSHSKRIFSIINPADRNSAVYTIEEFEQGGDYLFFSGYVLLKNKLHYEYKPVIILKTESGLIYEVKTYQYERLDIGADYPEYPFLYNTGFYARTFIQELERGHEYTVFIRMQHVFFEKPNEDIETTCRFYY